MFLVVESGSTKADWMLVSEGKETVYSSKGFNPYFHSKEDILIELNNHLELDLIKEDIQEIFFYGAGCSSIDLNAIIKDALTTFFTNAKVQVDHDLSASAYACYNNKPLITCILGTGSNSCYFDGETVSEEVPALSYILGDEGSGCHFGMALLSDFLYKRLPSPIDKELKQMGLSKAVIDENVYMKPNANVYISSFMPVLIRHKDLPYAQELIKKSFQQFIDIHVKCFKNYAHVEVSFVGSVASLLQDELKAVCKENNITIGSIIRRPLDRLVSYHKNKKQVFVNSMISNKANHLN